MHSNAYTGLGSCQRGVNSVHVYSFAIFFFLVSILFPDGRLIWGGNAARMTYAYGRRKMKIHIWMSARTRIIGLFFFSHPYILFTAEGEMSVTVSRFMTRVIQDLGVCVCGDQGAGYWVGSVSKALAAFFVESFTLCCCVLRAGEGGRQGGEGEPREPDFLSFWHTAAFTVHSKHTYARAPHVCR